MAVDRDDRELVALPIGTILPPRPIGAFWHGQRRPNVWLQAVCDAIGAALHELSGEADGAGLVLPLAG
jgi:hypothetical protein